MEIKIPKSVTLAAEVIPVEIVKTIDDDPTIEGLAVASGYPKIYISTFAEGSHREYVFFHEFMHMVLSAANEEKLYGDETFVSRFATFLHQAIATSDAKATTIPGSFVLGGMKFIVVSEDKIEDDEDCDGLACYGESKIKLANKNKGDYALWVFYHELTHCILFMMGDDKHRTDEAFVSRVSTFIHQGLKSLA